MRARRGIPAWTRPLWDLRRAAFRLPGVSHEIQRDQRPGGRRRYSRAVAPECQSPVYSVSEDLAAGGCRSDPGRPGPGGAQVRIGLLLAGRRLVEPVAQIVERVPAVFGNRLLQ